MRGGSLSTRPQAWRNDDATAQTPERGSDPACGRNLAARRRSTSLPPASASLRVPARAAGALSRGPGTPHQMPTATFEQGPLTAGLRVPGRDRHVTWLGLAGHGAAEDAYRRRLRRLI